MDNRKPDALTRLYHEQKDRLLAWLGSKVDTESAEDLLHDVFYRACRNLDALEPIRDLAGWLWRVAANGLRDRWRQTRRHPDSLALDELELELASSFRSVDDELLRAELLAALETAIDYLSPEQALVIRQHCLAGRSLRQLAEQTGLPINTLASRKRYALSRLRQSLYIFLEEA
ncbi:MAG: hypothetical protein A2Y37_12570 [Spirochaetes bacterium GWB1_60_80]|nr:MAG: hypothetical protein A2Y37_12570 [Spirochaetes bacterium GWB1_60_80]OHD43232.1 MAG: hypothetical protein A2Y35_08380 [Spirochaetes bacterium GWE1_60_18]OHD58792.1 MAG: hypothetical protein A2Y32_01215 [Spirochaetes bacterium GWF1_60_12]